MMGQCTISCRNIPWGISLACRRNSFLGDCAVTFEFDEADSHRWQHWTPRETAQGNRRLGGMREGICCVYLVCELHCSIVLRAR